MNIYEVKQLFFEASNATVVVGSDPTKANQKNFYRHYTVNGTRREPPYGELTSLLAPEAEHVTSLALQKLLADLMAEQSNLSAYIFVKNRQEVLQLSIHELTETVFLFKDRL